MFWGGMWSTLINAGIYAWTISQGGDPAKAMSMIFVALILIQFCKAYAFRSDRVSTFVRPFENRWLNAAILWELVMLFGLVYIPALHIPFGTYPLSVEDWIVVVFGALTILPLLEVVKRAQQRS
jgi:Ca2+-transporting ATPase